jgi:hypothetical protein
MKQYLPRFALTRPEMCGRRGEATWPRRRRAAVCTCTPPLVTGPVDARRHEKGIYLIERAEATLVAVLRE